MRTAKIKLLDVEYTLCFSAGVMIACDEKYGGIDKALQNISDGRFETVFWLLYEMMKAGANYDEINHIQHPVVEPYEYYTAVVGFDELANMQESITNAVLAGQERNFEISDKRKTTKKKTNKSRKEPEESSISTTD